jgi:hypothetical protein
MHLSLERRCMHPYRKRKREKDEGRTVEKRKPKEKENEKAHTFLGESISINTSMVLQET